MKIYAGIGSRSTPADICLSMTNLAQQLAKHGWKLRSGHADGADKAFEAGTNWPNMEIFLPWYGFNGVSGNDAGYCVPFFTDLQVEIAQRFHPNWAACSQAARKLHIRNVCQVLGLNCDKPADMVVCWTEGGKGGGGTGQAIRIAKGHNILVFDLYRVEDHQRLVDFVNMKEAA